MLNMNINCRVINVSCAVSLRLDALPVTRYTRARSEHRETKRRAAHAHSTRRRPNGRVLQLHLSILHRQQVRLFFADRPRAGLGLPLSASYYPSALVLAAVTEKRKKYRNVISTKVATGPAERLEGPERSGWRRGASLPVLTLGGGCRHGFAPSSSGWRGTPSSRL